MGKDFCFLFYFEKFAFGTRKMDRRHKGAYVDLLIEQADLFINCKEYKMSLSYVKHVLSSDFDTWEKIKEKYSCEDGMYWNESLLEKQIARKVFTDSRKNNRLGKKKKDNTSLSSDKHMVNKDKDKNITKEVKEIIKDLNQKAGTNYKPTTPKTKELIKARINEGMTVENFKTVNTNMIKEWEHDEKMAKYIRPITLYSNKCESYLNHKLGTGMKKHAGIIEWLDKKENENGTEGRKEICSTTDGIK